MSGDASTTAHPVANRSLLLLELRRLVTERAAQFRADVVELRAQVRAGFVRLREMTFVVDPCVHATERD